MKKKKIKLCLTKQLLNMFKLWCEWGIRHTYGYFPPSRVSFGEKIRTRASFTKVQANYISEESLINADYNKNIV